MSVPLKTRREDYEGAGGWHDGRLGMAYDLIDEATLDAGIASRNHKLLAMIEALDDELRENAA